MGEEIQKSGAEAAKQKEKTQTIPESSEQWKEFEEKFGKQFKDLIEIFKEKMGHEDKIVRNKAQLGYQKLVHFISSRDQKIREEFLYRVSKFNSEEVNRLVNGISESAELDQEGIQASQLFEFFQGSKWKSYGLTDMKHCVEYITSTRAVFNDSKNQEKLGAASYLEWIEKNVDFINKEKLKINQINYLLKLAGIGLVPGTLNEKTFEVMPKPLLSDLEEAQFPPEYVLQAKTIMDPNKEGYERRQDLRFFAVIFASDYYQALSKEWGDKLIFTFINATCPSGSRTPEHAAQAIAFIKDPAFNSILNISKYSPIPPENDPQLCIAAGRSLYFNLNNKEYSGGLEMMARRAFQEVMNAREKYGETKLFEDVVLFSNNEVGYQNSEDQKERESNKQRFASDELLSNMKKETKSFNYQIAPPDSDYVPSITSGKNGKTYDTQRSNFNGDPKKFRLMVESEIINTPLGKTFIFKGHGLPDTFYFSDKQTMSATEFADLLKKRYEKNPPKAEAKPDIFMFSSCHSSEFFRKVNDALGKTKTHAIFVQGAEYGYYGYSGDDFGLNLEKNYLDNVTLNLLLEIKNRELRKKNALMNNAGIYLRLGELPMQIGKKEGFLENQPHERAA